MSPYPHDYAHLPPPDPPELPPGVRRGAPWPWWYGLAGFAAWAAAAAVIGGALYVLAAGVFDQSLDDPSPGLNVFGTVVQDGLLVATALGLAALVMPPRPWQFGLRATRFWPAVGWSALGYGCFFVFAIVYSVAIGSTEEQTTLDDLGAKDTTLSLLVVGVMVCVAAPVIEEFFFRGFLYTALRRRLPTIAAAVIVGVLFGSVHIPTGAEAAPVLAVLGLMLCLVYEKTGSIYPCIALHALQNGVAYSVGADAPEVGLPLAAAVVAGCVFVPRLGQARSTPPALA